MTHTPTAPAPAHSTTPLATVRALRAAAMSCADDAPRSMPDDDVLTAIAEAHAAQQAVTALLLHLIQQADTKSLTKIKRRAGTSTWLAEELRMTIPAARRLAKRARQVCARPRLAAALRTGQVNAEQAGAIAHAVHDLPGTTDAARTNAAEAMLIAEADQLDSVRLARSSDRVLDLLDPAGADARAAVRRRRTDAASHAPRYLSVTPAPGGDAVRLSGVFDARSAAVLEAALHRYGTPGTPPPSTAPPSTTGSSPVTPTAAQRRADALVEICRRSLVAPARATAAVPDNHSSPLAADPDGVVIALNTPRSQLTNRSTRKRTKTSHHSSSKNGRSRNPIRR